MRGQLIFRWRQEALGLLMHRRAASPEARVACEDAEAPHWPRPAGHKLFPAVYREETRTCKPCLSVSISVQQACPRESADHSSLSLGQLAAQGPVRHSAHCNVCASGMTVTASGALSKVRRSPGLRLRSLQRTAIVGSGRGACGNRPGKDWHLLISRL